MRPATLIFLFVVACDPRSYPVGTSPPECSSNANCADPDAGASGPGGAPGGAQGAAATGGVSGVGAGGTAGQGTPAPGVAACEVVGAPLPERPVSLPPAVLADRLARFIWNVPADIPLGLKVQSVRTTRDVQELAASMTADPRFQDGYRSLMLDWLGLQPLLAPGLSSEDRARADGELRASMEGENYMFVRDLFTGDARLSTLLLASHTFVDQRLAEHYGLPPVMGQDFVRVEQDPQRRSGILTLAGTLFLESKISRRGNWVLNKLLCEGVPPPPAPPFGDPAPPRAPGETDRELLARSTVQAACQGCHNLIDPPGFAFEHYDDLGRWRDLDNGKPIDASGSLPMPPLRFDGARQLAEQVLSSCQVQRCAVQVYLQRALGSPDVGSWGERDDLLRAFIASGLDLRALFTLVAASPAFLAP